MKTTHKNVFVLLFILLIGLVLGGLIGEVFKNYFSILTYTKAIGFSPVTIDLGIMKLTLGFSMHLNLSNVIGIVIAFVLFRRIY